MPQAPRQHGGPGMHQLPSAMQGPSTAANRVGLQAAQLQPMAMNPLLSNLSAAFHPPNMLPLGVPTAMLNATSQIWQRPPIAINEALMQQQMQQQQPPFQAMLAQQHLQQNQMQQNQLQQNQLQQQLPRAAPQMGDMDMRAGRGGGLDKPMTSGALDVDMRRAGAQQPSPIQQLMPSTNQHQAPLDARHRAPQDIDERQARHNEFVADMRRAEMAQGELVVGDDVL